MSRMPSARGHTYVCTGQALGDRLSYSLQNRSPKRRPTEKGGHTLQVGGWENSDGKPDVENHHQWPAQTSTATQRPSLHADTRTCPFMPDVCKLTVNAQLFNATLKASPVSVPVTDDWQGDAPVRGLRGLQGGARLCPAPIVPLFASASGSPVWGRICRACPWSGAPPGLSSGFHCPFTPVTSVSPSCVLSFTGVTLPPKATPCISTSTSASCSEQGVPHVRCPALTWPT